MEYKVGKGAEWCKAVGFKSRKLFLLIFYFSVSIWIMDIYLTVKSLLEVENYTTTERTKSILIKIKHIYWTFSVTQYFIWHDYTFLE